MNACATMRFERGAIAMSCASPRLKRGVIKNPKECQYLLWCLSLRLERVSSIKKRRGCLFETASLYFLLHEGPSSKVKSAFAPLCWRGVRGRFRGAAADVSDGRGINFFLEPLAYAGEGAHDGEADQFDVLQEQGQ